MSSDIGLGVVGIPAVGALARKPPHLIELSEGKGKSYFLSFDKPELLNNFIQVKGAFISEVKELSEVKDLAEYIGALPKDTVVECYLPVHRVLSIKNLMFKAK